MAAMSATAEIPPTWAVIPSAGRDLLQDCIASLVGQVDGIVIVANGELRGRRTAGTVTVDDTGTGRNISRWWNLGIDHVERRMILDGVGRWNTLVVNDDVVAPPNLAGALAHTMRNTTAVLAYPNQHDGFGTVWTRAEPVNLFHRITGYAYMLRGEIRLRLDESMAWWYSDDSLDWEAREAGGAALVPGCAVEHRRPNGYMHVHPELGAQAGRDRQTFQTKWGRTPW
jgi:hypothetical protein